MQPTNVDDPRYYHRVVDCQWACPAHTNVPEYIRLIAQGRFTESYLLNRQSNVFPGILGRTCDRPCEPACRRGRVDGKPVAICRLKRVAADHKDDIRANLPAAPAQKNGKRVALIGGGPSALTVANDLAPLGYAVTLFEKHAQAGGLMRVNIPSFRLPAEVLDEEVGYILDMGVDARFGTEVTSMKALLDDGYDAVFVGSGAPKGKELDIPGRWDAPSQVHIGIEWLANVHFGHIESIGQRVLIIGVGNTAMDCCRTSRRLGGTNGKLVGMEFERLSWSTDAKGKQKSEVTDTVVIPCDAVILAIGQENAFTWIERDIGIEFDEWGMPKVDKTTHASTRAGVFFGGDAAWGPENIIWAVAHGHAAAISMHNHCQGIPVTERPPEGQTLVSTKMGMHSWSYHNDYSAAARTKMTHAELTKRFSKLSVEVELGFTPEQTANEVQRCLNCDVQTHFTTNLCIECDACVDVCPVNCLTITANGDEADLRTRLSAPAINAKQEIYVSGELPQTKRVMVKDEDLCLHCGLCAERCPTAAWDMRRFDLLQPYAGRPGSATARSLPLAGMHA